MAWPCSPNRANQSATRWPYCRLWPRSTTCRSKQLCWLSTFGNSSTNDQPLTSLILREAGVGDCVKTLTNRAFSQICVVRVSRFFSNRKRVCSKFFQGIFTPTWCSGNVFMKIFFQNNMKWLSLGNSLLQWRHTQHMLKISSKLGTNEKMTLIISAGNELISQESSPSLRGSSKRGKGGNF